MLNTEIYLGAEYRVGTETDLTTIEVEKFSKACCINKGPGRYLDVLPLVVTLLGVDTSKNMRQGCLHGLF